MPDNPATPDPIKIFKSKEYISLLVVAAIVGIPIAVFAYFFLFLISQIQQFIFVDIPSNFDSSLLKTWWPIIPLAISGLIVGFAVSKMPGKGGEVPLEGLKAGGGPIKPVYLWSIALAAVASISLGAVVGPEAPLIALGGGMAYLIVKTLKKTVPKQAGAMVSASGSFASVSTLLGSPLTGAFLLMEASGLGGLRMELVLLPGLLAAGVGYLIFVGLDSLTGLGTFSLTLPDIPAALTPTISEILFAIVLGLIAPLVIYVIKNIGLKVYEVINKKVILFTALGGILIGVLAIIFELITNQSSSYILFSGQDQLANLINGASALTLVSLLLIILLKGIAYGISLAGFRGGPTFPAMFIGAALGILVAKIFDLDPIACVGIGIGSMTVSALKLPLTAVLLTTIFLGTSGVKIMPVTIIAVVIAYVVTMRMKPITINQN